MHLETTLLNKKSQCVAASIEQKLSRVQFQKRSDQNTKNAIFEDPVRHAI